MGLRSWLGGLVAIAVAASPTLAEPIRFDQGWREQGFFRLWTNRYTYSQNRLDIVSDGTVSLVWRKVEASEATARAATWRWQVKEGVSATDLSQKGADDRNIAVYFVFVDKDTAHNLKRNTARKLLKHPNTRGLVYVWGGDQDVGTFQQSPYHPKLVTRILREAGTGSFRENVDLAADYRTAFGEPIGALVGLGISSDSDDTEGRIVASVEGLELLGSEQ